MNKENDVTPADIAKRHIESTRIIAILRGNVREHALRIGEILVASGITAIEVTTVSPGYAEIIRALAARFSESAAIGVGTVLTQEHLLAAVGAGASFVVSPNTKPCIIRQTRDMGLASFPGAYTPTEIVTAMECGADAVKLFPAAGLGPGFVRALLGPFPDWKFVPTGGIHLENMDGYFDVGAYAIGVGSELVGRNELTTLDEDAFAHKARAFAVKARRTRR